MLNSRGVSEQLEKTYEEYKHLAAEVFALVEESGEEESLLREVNLLETLPAGKICYIKEGYLKLKRGNREIRMFSTGDFTPATGNWSAEFEIISDFKSDLIVFSQNEILKKISEDKILRDKWSLLWQFEHRLTLSLCGEFAPEIFEFDMVVKNFSKGELIINEEDAATAIFEMISGKADVFMGNAHVGTIGNNELFGELPFLCAEARKTTVIARRNCFVRILEPNVFFNLIESNTQFATTLLRSLATRVNRLNCLISDFKVADVDK